MDRPDDYDIYVNEAEQEGACMSKAEWMDKYCEDPAELEWEEREEG